MVAKQQQQQKQTPQQPSQDERHYRAVAAAQMGVAKRGPKALVENLNRGRWARYEKQVDDLFPGLHERDPHDFAARVKALNRAHMMRCTAASVAARKQRAQECPECYEERGEAFPANSESHICAAHQAEWNRKFERMRRARNVSPERAAEIALLAMRAYLHQQTATSISA